LVSDGAGNQPTDGRVALLSELTELLNVMTLDARGDDRARSGGAHESLSGRRSVHAVWWSAALNSATLYPTAPTTTRYKVHGVPDVSLDDTADSGESVLDLAEVTTITVTWRDSAEALLDERDLRGHCVE
jgi:hypothetical protein